MEAKKPTYTYPCENSHDPSLDGASGTYRLHALETGQQSEHDDDLKLSGQMKQINLEDHCDKNGAGSIFKPEKLCAKKTLNIMEINCEVFMQICRYLNIKRVLGGDYRSLAAKLDYTMTDIQCFSQEKNPTESILSHWGSGKDRFAIDILKIAEEMSRHDVVVLLEKEIRRKCKNCNCLNCGSIS